MIYVKKIINQDIERTPTFNVESIREFFKINLSNGQTVNKTIKLIPKNIDFDVKFQKRETRDEYRVFLNELFHEINANEGDILIFRKQNADNFICEHISITNRSYPHLNHLFEDRNNHQIIIEDGEGENPIISKQNVLDRFADWFISKDGLNHNYFKDYFTSNKEKVINELRKYDALYVGQFNAGLFDIVTNDLDTTIAEIEKNIYKEDGDFFELSRKTSNHMPRAILGKKNYLAFLKELQQEIIGVTFNTAAYISDLKKSGLIFSDQIVNRFVASLCTKPFVICSGLSGSGKTKLAQSFVQWIASDKSQYEIIPVGSDWTNREPLLGYPNALNKHEYVTPENGVLDLMIRAKNNLENESEVTKPYFLILDEMNLSHVERYFADFLSAMESSESIPLHKIIFDNEDVGKIPMNIALPKNFFIIGTVNIDETTYMFSPKVLDRANTIEFRLKEEDLISYINNNSSLDMNALASKGTNMSKSFIELSMLKTGKNLLNVEEEILQFFTELKKSGAEFGYRTANEIGRLMKMLEILGVPSDDLLDIAIMQKLLPKLHGSRNKLTSSLTTLAKFCVDGAVNNYHGKDDEFRKHYFIGIENISSDQLSKIKYKLSFEKISRMYRNAIDNGFTSYAEA
jgi:5-methylcytosine-specific restriction enzyme B